MWETWATTWSDLIVGSHVHKAAHLVHKDIEEFAGGSAVHGLASRLLAFTVHSFAFGDHAGEHEVYT